MKKKSPPYALIVAALLAAVAIYAFFQYKNAQDQKARDEAASVRKEMEAQLAAERAKPTTVVQEQPTNLRYVLYATQPVEPGLRLSAAFFEKKLTPKDILPDAYGDEGDIVGWFAIRKIEKGDPLTPRNVGKSLPYMSQRITPGMRAISLEVYNSTYNRTSGFIVDGDKVDLLYTTDSVDGVYKLGTQMVMQNVSVLYVPGPAIKTDKTDGINPVPPPGDTIAVTFEVTPEQAQALIYLSSVKNGRFDMIMRARSDTDEINIRPFNGPDYMDNLKKVQRMVDKSNDRVKSLADAIAAKEKNQAQGTTNDTANPAPPVQ